MAGARRVDFLVREAAGEVFLNEINTLPGSMAFYLWQESGMSPQQVVDELIGWPSMLTPRSARPSTTTRPACSRTRHARQEGSRSSDTGARAGPPEGGAPSLDRSRAEPARSLASDASAGGLASGTYRSPASVPYVAQFASPERICDYIHRGYDGTHDPRWRTFGATEPGEYAFWAPRVCALACIKMAVEAFYPQRQPTLWQLVKEGLAADGYRLRDERGRWIDEGWTVHAQIYLAARYGLVPRTGRMSRR